MDLFGETNFEPGSGPTKTTNVSVAETRICIKRCVMSHHWNPTKKEIEKWLDRKIHEFATQEKKLTPVKGTMVAQISIHRNTQDLLHHLLDRSIRVDR